MAGDAAGIDPARALELKERGNKCFQTADYLSAHMFYSQAINYDSTNPLLYTNRAMSLLHIDPPDYKAIISDSQASIRLLPSNMKAYFFLAQGQVELHLLSAALESALEAHRLCVEECRKIPMGKGASSIGPITELVLRCKKERWEEKESERLARLNGLQREMVELLREKGESDDKIEVLKDVFQKAGEANSESKRRKVPDWCIDDITFSVMVDPVVTKTGQSYDRASLMEHLKRSSTDPLTREPLRMEDLRPNLALKEACNAFLEENGWAVDW